MSLRLLIADDDLEILDLLKFAFEAERYEVETAIDGEDAWKKIQAHQPDIVILDVTMPKMTGFDVCEKIRSHSTTCLMPVILLTSRSSTSERVNGLKLGADDYVVKPFEPLELSARVERLIRRNREALSANPLTGLPGNVTIEREIRRRLSVGESFAVMYTDIDNFKAFNDAYGFERGDSIIRLTSSIFRSAVTKVGTADDFLGHIGGDDFILVTRPEHAPAIAKMIIYYFDTYIPQEYDEAVRSRGYVQGVDRQGQSKQFPLMTISIGCVQIQAGVYVHYAQIAERAKDLLKQSKQAGKSNCITG
ncbi:MAG: response regulator [Endomicrobiales bacterium]|jgi:diguanylate cyclase (GGDEF)-like protein